MLYLDPLIFIEKVMIEGIGLNTKRDANILEDRAEYFEKQSGNNIEDILANFPTFSRRINITRFLAHYELYKKVSSLPGSIVELGVYKGASLFSFAHFLEIFHPGDRSRKVIGFDSFEGLDSFTEKDGSSDKRHYKKKGGYSAKSFESDLHFFQEKFSSESFVPQSPRIDLIKGDILSTVPEFVSKNPGLRISLLHFDCDLYEPTLVGLKYLKPLLVPGAIIAFDEYAITAWAGESKAVDEFFDKKVKLEKFSWTSLPGGFIQI